VTTAAKQDMQAADLQVLGFGPQVALAKVHPTVFLYSAWAMVPQLVVVVALVIFVVNLFAVVTALVCV
jgi:hypothetical protein